MMAIRSALSSLSRWIAQYWKQILIEWIAVFCCLLASAHVAKSYADYHLYIILIVALLIALILVRFFDKQLQVTVGPLCHRDEMSIFLAIDGPRAVLSDSVRSFNSGIPDDVSELTAPSMQEKEAWKPIRVTKFWKGVETQQLRKVEIEGTVSQYAPFVIGPPFMKRQKHLELRQSKNNRLNPDTLNLLLAFTAGQMVWSLEPMEGWRFLGLYQSIVRNSIPLVVEEEYYDDFLKRNNRNGNDVSGTFDAEISGDLVQLPYFDKLYEAWIRPEQNASSGVKASVFSDVGKIYGLVIKRGSGYIRYKSETKYLDGDAWIAIEYKGEQSLESRFCDLSNKIDVQEQMEDLKNQLAEKKPGYKIVYDFENPKPEPKPEEKLHHEASPLLSGKGDASIDIND